jgi:hypothetical protein
MRDNGMLNSAFLRKCKKIGYIPLGDILPHWKDRDIRYENGVGLLLEYWKLSSSEQKEIDSRVLREMGFVHEVVLGQEDVGRGERAVLQTILDNGQVFEPWTHFYPPDWVGTFRFTNHRDAVQFSLTAG